MSGKLSGNMTLTRIRVPAGFVVAAIVLYLATPTLKSIAMGLTPALLGLLFRASAAGTIQKNESLASRGPYRLTRNPLYFGSFLLSAGFSIMSGSLVSAGLLMIPFAVIYDGVIRKEESHLSELFGAEFQQFRRAVPRFFPRRVSLRIMESFSRTQYLTNREYNAALGFVAATVVLLIKYLARNP
jgi:protein-S-isoprenylcysteine O-methyltransferase Ste14